VANQAPLNSLINAAESSNVNALADPLSKASAVDIDSGV